MRSTLLALSLTLALAPAAAFEKPGIDAFFDAMAIEAAPGQQSRFVAGDNLAGYFEGFTHSHERGAGYVLKSGTVFHNYVSSVDGVANARAGGREQVLPFGHRVAYANGSVEELALLSKRHALALRVGSARPARLGLKPLLITAGAVTQRDGVVIVAPGKGATQYMALAASQAFTLEDGLLLRASAPATSFTVVAAFGASAAEAGERARRLAAGDPIGDERRATYAALTRSYLATSDVEYNKALNWAKAASKLFVVDEYGAGIWAGLPWFRENWGRDTFIALPGTLLVSGQFADAKAVLANFARFQNLRTPRDKDYGRIPNRVSPDEIIYNTVDGTPWMLREAHEYIRYTGDKAFAREMYKLAVPYFEGAIANYVDTDGLLRHAASDTWMDARIENATHQPWSDRGPRANDIQALWYTALNTGAWLADQAGDAKRAREWRALAAKARASFLRLFWDGAAMADRLRADGSRDLKVRPNQLMVATIPFDDFVPGAVQARVTKNAVSALLYPYGIASLSQDDPTFHPRHENPDFHHKDAAYHNGTIWGWNAGFTVTALNRFGYQDLSWALTQNLGKQILGVGIDGTLGNMSENLDALPHPGGKLKPSGTFAQSWSVAEYARNGYQDYVGFRPDLPNNMLAFEPAIPGAWSRFEAVLPFGFDEEIAVDFSRKAARQRWTFTLRGKQTRTLRMAWLNDDKRRMQSEFTLAPGKPVTLELGAGRATLDGRRLALRQLRPSYADTIGTLRFAKPKDYRSEDFPMLRERDALRGIVERGEYR
ncbi:amylo-alpha-1,6-glucosidase [Massilia sp. Leaf139]|uniref:amylo-alpha-1,6-glucosidase n=1 Tax=Massilia sp. Leaf139 TaxID=1736272 RepID=UPI0006FADAF5|nr:amylo-alpha-1,6-glucosidase [Massilia sp. Leaf139]